MVFLEGNYQDYEADHRKRLEAAGETPRNLVPLIIAHGLIDAWAMTALYLGRPELLFGS